MRRPRLPLLSRDRYDFAISYSARDAEAVLPIVRLLRERGYRVFEYADELASRWGESLEEYLGEVFSEEACCYVCFWSRNYLAGRWTLHEYRTISRDARARPRLLVLGLDETPETISSERFRRLEESTEPITVCRLLAHHLARLEGWLEPGDEPPLTLIASSARTVDSTLLQESLDLARGPLDALGIRLRLPADLRSLFSTADTAEDGTRAEVSRLESEELPLVAQGLRLLASMTGSPHWSPDEIATAMAAYFSAECLSLASRAASQLPSKECTIDEPELLQLGGGFPVSFVPSLAFSQSAALISPYWFDIDISDRKATIAGIRKRLFWAAIPTQEGEEEELRRGRLVRCLAPQLAWLSVRSPGFDHPFRDYLENLERVDVLERRELIVDPCTGEHDYASNPGGRRITRRIERELRPFVERQIRAGRLSVLNRDHEKNVALYLSRLSLR